MNNDPQLPVQSGRVISCAWAMPYLMAAWCCLAIVQGSPTNIPPLIVLFKTIGTVLVAVALIHAVLVIAIKKTPARELILLAMVSFVGLYGGFGIILSLFIGWYAFTAVWVVLHLAFIVVVYRHGKHRLTTGVVPVATLAIGLTLCLQIFGVGMPVAGDSSRVTQLMSELASKDASVKTQATSSTSEQPDIYYIIVDAYAGESILKQIYGYDNQVFISSLRDRGFFIGDRSCSNYPSTELSLASSLNMTHLHELGLKQFKTRIPIRKMIADSSVARFLKQQGYQTIAFETGKLDTQCEQFDQYVTVGNALNDYQDVLYHETILPSLLELSGIPFRSPGRRHADRIMETLNSIPTVVQADAKPSFVFSHLLSPHPPFVIDEQGKDVDVHGYYLLADGQQFTSRYDYDLEIYRNAYRSQVASINKNLIEMVDRIQSSDRHSVIIIQADHGPRLGFGADPDSHTSPDELNRRFREAFSILNAIYLPENLKPEFYTSMTPVNTFRLIFNEVFDAEFSLEADECYFETDYSFENVTQNAVPQNAVMATEVTQNN